MALFGSGKASRGSARGSFATRTSGVSPATRAARARKGHQRRASHLFASQGAKKGRKTTYRKGRGRLF